MALGNEGLTWPNGLDKLQGYIPFILITRGINCLRNLLLKLIHNTRLTITWRVDLAATIKDGLLNGNVTPVSANGRGNTIHRLDPIFLSSLPSRMQEKKH